MYQRKESFTCLYCGEQNPVIPANERNHCRKCLFSFHVDKEVPGDRLEQCKNLMEPMYVSINGKKGYIITHRCTRCSIEKRNKAAPDDSIEKMASFMNTMQSPESHKTIYYGRHSKTFRTIR